VVSVRIHADGHVTPRDAAVEQNRLEMLQLITKTRELDLSQRTMLTLEALREIGEAFTGIPGRKSLIWATGGFAIEPFDIIVDGSQYGVHDRRLLPLYENAWSALNHANIAVYPLDVEELVNTAYVGPEVRLPLPEHFDIRSKVTSLERFADATGGRLCERQTDAEGCFHEAVNDSTDYYLLGFYANSSKVKPGWQKLAVKVRNPDMRVQARSGYFISSRQNENLGRKEDIELGLSSPLEYTGLPVKVRWTTTTQLGEKQKVGFQFVLAPAATTIDEADNNHVSLEFAAMATTATGEPAGHFLQNLEGRLKPDAARKLKSEGATYPGTIDLAPGDYTVRFLIRDNLSGQMGTVSAPLNVP
jgi:hypothetical protein